jgi:hypothetical protein
MPLVDSQGIDAGPGRGAGSLRWSVDSGVAALEPIGGLSHRH